MFVHGSLPQTQFEGTIFRALGDASNCSVDLRLRLVHLHDHEGELPSFDIVRLPVADNAGSL